MAYRVPLGKFTIGNSPEQSISDQLVHIISSSPVDPANPGAGFGFAEIRIRGKLCDAIEAVGKDAEFVDLEDAQYEKLKTIIEVTPYMTADRGVLKMINAVLDAEKVK